MKVYSVVEGKRKALEDVEDIAFAQKMLGDGVAIVPSVGQINAPCNGEVMMVFPSNHALGLKSEEGIEFLIHIGIDTVEMQGEGFRSNVKQGDIVKRGDCLVSVDLEKISNAGYASDVMLIITNMDDSMKLTQVDKDEVTCDDVILEIDR